MTSPHDPGDLAGSGADRAGPRRGGVSLDELADLQAGLLTPDEEVVLRARVAADPGAADLLDALEQTRLELAHLDNEPVPSAVVSRIDAAVTAEANAQTAASEPAPDPVQDPAVRQDGLGGGGAVVELAAARPRPRPERSPSGRAGVVRSRLGRWLGAGLAVAAAVVVSIVVGVVADGPGSQRPQPGSAPGAPAINAGELAAQWPGITASRDLGFLAAPGKLERCVSATDARADPAQLLGARPVVVDGQYGVLIAVPTSSAIVPGRPVLLAVLGPNCALSFQEPDVIAQTTIST